MAGFKYFDGIRAAQKRQPPLSKIPAFDIERLRTKGIGARLAAFFIEDHPRFWLTALRRFWPNLAIGRFLLVTRNADVREILKRGEEFQVPYGLEMTELARGSNFILGMQDGEDYRRMKSSILSAFPPEEVEALVRPIAVSHSREIMATAGSGFDAIGGLMKIVPVRICRDYFGLDIDDENEFADWSIALSALFFSDPFASPATRELAVVAADRLIGLIDRSIVTTRQKSEAGRTTLARLVAIMDDGRFSLADLHSAMLGMIAGFVPTNLLAGGNCLDVILSKPEARQAIEEGLQEPGNDRLDRAILEAMRFKPIWIGPWRFAACDATIAEGTPRQRLVKAGTVVMPATLSAMFDAEAVQSPGTFDTARQHRDYMVFGYGIHLCIGAEMARIQIAESLRALFQKQRLRRTPGKAGRMTRIGAYPESLKVDFDPQDLCRTVAQSMVTMVCPTRDMPSLDAIRDRIALLGNPPTVDIRMALDAAATIHFASLSVVTTAPPAEVGGDESGVLVLELSGDGTPDEVIDAMARAAGVPLREIFEAACDIPAGGALQALLRKHSLTISPSFGSNAGLVFAGTPGHSVRRILAEAELAETVRAIVEKPGGYAGQGAAGALGAVRRELAADGRFGWAFEPADSLFEKGEGSTWKAFKATIRAPLVFPVVLALAAFLWWVTYALAFGQPLALSVWTVMVGMIALVLALVELVALALLVLAGLAFALRRLENRDRPSNDAVDLDSLDSILVHENWSAQNHLAAVSTMKPGILRRLALRFAFYLISISAQKVFKPGFLANISTIHFARWVLLPGAGKLMFLSNYGGSWESYLEDFIAKAAAGLTGVWSNTEGYPRTRFLFLDGARAGDRFKRWARRQQVPTLFWYSAYPHLDTRRIRTNASIRSGIANAADSEARDWLSLFGSLPRPAEPVRNVPATLVSAGLTALADTPVEPIETGEIQALFFGPFGALEHARMLAIRIPDGLAKAGRKAWLEYVAGRATFGDGVPRDRAVTVAFGPDGLRRLGLEGIDGDDPLKTFPAAFRHGMGKPQRSRILDDIGASAPANWQWGSPEKPVDAAIVCYGASGDILQAEVDALTRQTLAAGMIVVAELPLVVNREPGEDGRRKRPRAVEHFGFVDGISQPVVRGTARANTGIAPMHLVAAGEFVFGYRDEHGFYPASPNVKASRDRDGILPPVRHNRILPGQQPSPHDFGRNGSFLVLRQFEQHVEEFHGYCRQAAAAIDDPEVTARWVASKMLGRWPDGSSLVRNPDGRPARTADNDYSFGVEDPQGHRCPLGAHVRRSNPRDSLGEDRDTQIRIGKRHRILRVGRSYEKPASDDSKAEKGLLFMCLNADIERQYEFIQQTWVSSTSFQGLVTEKDPTIGSAGGDGRYTIPSWEGVTVLRNLPQFVTTRGGGYFFMPSRSALRYLLSRL